MTDIAEALSIAKDIALAVAGVTGTIVAVKGLGTWKRQLRGQNDYEVARKVLRCTYQYRDAFAAARSPIMWSDEAAPFPDEKEVEAAHGHNLEQQRRYRRRFRTLSEAGRALEAELLEAEVLWGSEVVSLSRPLWGAATDLNGAIAALFQPTFGPAPHAERARLVEEAERRSEILYARGQQDEDPFRKRIEDAVAAIEQVFRKHIAA